MKLNQKVLSKVVAEIVEGKVYCVSVTPPEARRLFFVSSYDVKDPVSTAPDKHGYQRPPTKSRFAEIARYFRKGNNAQLITPITVSVRLTDDQQIERYLDLLKAGDLTQ